MVFGRLKRSHKAAKEHKSTQAEKAKEEAEKIPYRHVPTHAAIDAMAGAPGFREDDRPKIIEAHKRRSMMAGNQNSMNMSFMNPVHVGLPRVNSSLSHVSYPAVHANPVVRVPRTLSYSSAPAAWNLAGDQSYSSLDQGISLKGKEVERAVAGPSGSTSRSTSKETSPIISSGESTSSQEELEIKTARHSVASQPRTGVEARSQAEQVHRLASGRNRRPSDPMATSPNSSPNGSPPRGVRPTPSRASSGSSYSTVTPGIPPVPQLPPLSFPAASNRISDSNVHPIANEKRASLPSSLRKQIFAKREGQAVEPEKKSSLAPGAAITSPPVSYKPKRASKSTRFSALVTINALEPPKMPANARTRPTVETASLPTEFDFGPPSSHESVVRAAPPSSGPVGPQKSGKLFKARGGKLSKKNR